ncbi:MAG TPA: TIR domain-containing protein [Sphingobacteriaceae bacterium]
MQQRVGLLAIVGRGCVSDVVAYSYDVFISYSSKDAAWVRGELLQRLEQAGLKVIIDFRDFEIGVPSIINMERAVDASRHTLVVLTPNWITSEWTEFESLLVATRDPTGRRRKLLPLMLQKCDLPPRIALLTYLDMTDVRRIDEHMARLIKNLMPAQHAVEPAVKREDEGTATFPTRHYVPNPFSIADRITNQAHVSSHAAEAYQNRHRILDHVGYHCANELNNTLHDNIVVTLNIDYEPNLVRSPWTEVVPQAHHPFHSSVSNKTILDIFDDAGQKLLILGAAGVGKTTILCELTVALIARARQDETHAIPMMFNLASWGKKRLPLDQWLLSQMNLVYGVPKAIGVKLLRTNNILLLLDGLDEVKTEYRTDCVNTINEFRQDHGLLSIAVCSRKEEYQLLDMQLHLNSTIVIQQLTKEQVDACLETGGEQLAGVRTVFHHNHVLQELMTTPLMLSIVTTAYRGLPFGSIPLLEINELRTHVFNQYVDKMFERRGRSSRYMYHRMVPLLSWLAQHLKAQNQTEFYIETLQPNWLDSRIQGWSYVLGVQVLSAMIGCSISWFICGLWIGFNSALILGLIGGVLGLLFGYTKEIVTVERLQWSWKRVRNVFGSSLVIGVLLGVFTIRVSITLSLGIGLFSTLWFTLLGALIFGPVKGKIDKKIVPNQGIRQSARNAIVFGLGIGLPIAFLLSIMGLAETLSIFAMIQIVRNLLESNGVTNVGPLFVIILQLLLVVGILVPSGGLLATTLMILLYGGRACIQHAVLRVLLYSKGYIPWWYVRFLDDAASLTLLKKVGGGYKFIHESLLDHFASMNLLQVPTKSTKLWVPFKRRTVILLSLGFVVAILTIYAYPYIPKAYESALYLGKALRNAYTPSPSRSYGCVTPNSLAESLPATVEPTTRQGEPAAMRLDTPTIITFRNTRQQATQLHLLNREGKFEYQHTVGSYQEQSVATFTSACWLATDKDGSNLRTFIVEREESMIIIK